MERKVRCDVDQTRLCWRNRSIVASNISDVTGFAQKMVGVDWFDDFFSRGCL
jgi:hypothetical protein